MLRVVGGFGFRGSTTYLLESQAKVLKFMTIAHLERDTVSDKGTSNI